MSERREWWIDNELHAWEWRENVESWMRKIGVLDNDNKPIHVREVLPDDPTPQWVDELIRLCERMTYLRDGAEAYWHVAKEIGEHLNKRGER